MFQHVCVVDPLVLLADLQMSSPSRALVFALLVAVVHGANDGIPRQSASSGSLIPLGAQAQAVLASAASLPVISKKGPVTGVSLTQYSDPKWDGGLIGSAGFWMGLASGGCGYGRFPDAVCTVSPRTASFGCG